MAGRRELALMKMGDGLVDIGYGKHYRVIHSKDEFTIGSSHINGIESFWSYAKHRLKKFHSTPKHTFYLHLKETEYHRVSFQPA